MGGFAKGTDVLLDALLLSKCDFLLKTTSAVSECAPRAECRGLTLPIARAADSRSLAARLFPISLPGVPLRMRPLESRESPQSQSGCTSGCMTTISTCRRAALLRPS